MRLRKKDDGWSIKQAHKKLLEYFESNFPSQIKAEPTGIFGFFDSDLEKLAKKGYLEIHTIIEGGSKNPIKTNYYSLGMRGLSELTELRNKRWFKLSVLIAMTALVISIISLAKTL